MPPAPSADMPIDKEFQNELRLLCEAGVRVMHLVSHEWERLRACLLELRTEGLHKNQPIIGWSPTKGIYAIEPGRHDLKDVIDNTLIGPSDILATIAGKNADVDAIWMVEDLHGHLTEDNHTLLTQLKDLARDRSRSKRLVVITSPFATLPPEVRKDIPTLELPLPRRGVLQAILQSVLAKSGHELPDNTEAIVDAASGLTVMEAELAFAKVNVEHPGLHQAEVLGKIAHEKSRVIKQTQILEFFQTETNLSQDVGGLENLKVWLKKRQSSFSYQAKEQGIEAPKGIMLLGVQGCGKSLIAKAIAKEWSYPLLRFDLGKVFGGIVGQSEGNIRSALQVAAALEPCVLWIDEIEKGLAGMGSSDRSDGGTTARVVGTLLTWMQEKKEQVFVVATANRIDMLPPELLRKGRFDEIFFVDLPTQSVRRQILKIHLQKRRKLDKATEAKLDELAEQTRGFSGAELEEMVREALLDWYADLPKAKPLADYLTRVAQQTNPLSVLMSTQIEDLRKWAGQRTRAASEGEPEDLPKKAEKPLLTPTESAQNRFFRPKSDSAN